MKLIYGIVNLIFKWCRIFAYFESKYGIKSLNAKSFRCVKMPLLEVDEIYLQPKDLFLGIDLLSDENTLLDINILESPHYHLMECLDSKGDIEYTDYINRLKNGRLDGRYASSVKGFIDNSMKIFSRNKQNILEGSCEPVLVYSVHGKFYIHDGKHRAALCSYLKKPIRCKQIDPNMVICLSEVLIDLMKKSKKSYFKHLEFVS